MSSRSLLLLLSCGEEDFNALLGNPESRKERRETMKFQLYFWMKQTWCFVLPWWFVHVNSSSTSHDTVPEISVMPPPQLATIIKDKCGLILISLHFLETDGAWILSRYRLLLEVITICVHSVQPPLQILIWKHETKIVPENYSTTAASVLLCGGGTGQTALLPLRLAASLLSGLSVLDWSKTSWIIESKSCLKLFQMVYLIICFIWIQTNASFWLRTNCHVFVTHTERQFETKTLEKQ